MSDYMTDEQMGVKPREGNFKPTTWWNPKDLIEDELNLTPSIGNEGRFKLISFEVKTGKELKSQWNTDKDHYVFKMLGEDEVEYTWTNVVDQYLSRAMRDCNIQAGDVFVIKFMGPQKHEESGRLYNLFDLTREIANVKSKPWEAEEQVTPEVAKEMMPTEQEMQTEPDEDINIEDIPLALILTIGISSITILSTLGGLPL